MVIKTTKTTQIYNTCFISFALFQLILYISGYYFLLVSQYQLNNTPLLFLFNFILRHSITLCSILGNTSFN